MIDTVEVLEKRLTLSFPYHVLKGAGGYYTKTHSAYLEVPPQFFFMAYLTCLGAVVSRRVRLESALKTQPRLYTVIVGESASDRKSTAIDLQSIISGMYSAKSFRSAWVWGLQRACSVF